MEDVIFSSECASGETFKIIKPKMQSILISEEEGYGYQRSTSDVNGKVQKHRGLRNGI